MIQIHDHAYAGEVRSGASCQFRHSDDTVCAEQAFVHAHVPDPQAHPYMGVAAPGQRCWYVPPLLTGSGNPQCALPFEDHPPRPRPAAACTHGADCQVHPQAQGIHNYGPTPQEQLKAAYRLVHADLTRRADEAAQQYKDRQAARQSGARSARSYIQSVENARAIIAREGGLEDDIYG